MQVKEILQVKGGALYTANAGQSLASAIATMSDLDLGSLVVVDGGRLVGIVTFREVLKALKAAGGKGTDVPLGEVMVTNPVTVSPDMDANDLRRLMIEMHSRYVPVVDDGRLLGVISFLDVAKAVLEEQRLENTLLKNYIKNWPEDAGN